MLEVQFFYQTKLDVIQFRARRVTIVRKVRSPKFVSLNVFSCGIHEQTLD